MNILFLCEYNVTPYKGGISTLISSLSNGFVKYFKDDCCLAFLYDNGLQTTPSFSKVLHIKDYSDLTDIRFFIESNHIDFIISTIGISKRNSLFFSEFYQYIRSNTNCVLFWTYLMRPDNDIFISSFLHGVEHKIPLIGTFVSKTLLLFFHCRIVEIFINKFFQKKYSVPYYNCDQTVVQSSSYIPLYYKLCGINNKRPIKAIPNPLVFDDYSFDKSGIPQKEKKVLIVARYDEPVKRYRLALRIWKEIEKDASFNEWELVILGYGPDEKLIKDYAKQLELRNVSFNERQSPVEYYKKCSIYMMTSAIEGSPMVLNDAKQFGLVPIVFNSFESAGDLIKHKYNGILIQDNNESRYLCELKYLMSNDVERCKMAENAIDDSSNFRVEKVCGQWRILYENILSEIIH